MCYQYITHSQFTQLDSTYYSAHTPTRHTEIDTVSFPTSNRNIVLNFSPHSAVTGLPNFTFSFHIIQPSSKLALQNIHGVFWITFKI